MVYQFKTTFMDELKKDEHTTDQKRNQDMPAGKPGDGDKNNGDKKQTKDTK
ncbi:hypothetical protein K2P47_02775 [Patescibacteria group bacterium]|nr:hypothetical protein [Patescibacteria group bacterium]